MKFSTKAIHTGEEPNYEINGEVVSPIHLSTTFARRDPEVPAKGYEYTRTSNPTREALEKKLASLEEARFGLAFASGLAAETSLLLSLLKKGDMILASDDLYGGTRRIFESVIKKFGVEYRTVDLTSEVSLESLEPEPRLIWIETPSNPLLKIIDIASLSRKAHKIGSMLVVDNTFATPYFQNPLKFGCDVVIHSTTKYVSGHSDTLGGATVTNNEELFEKLKFHQNAVGAVLSPFDSYMTMRGIKTLSIRMREHEKNAIRIAEYLTNRSEVERVYYPGLEDHFNHEVAKRQMKGYGGIVSFTLNLNKEKIRRFLRNLRYIALGESLGGVESLIEIPSLMTHASIPKNIRDLMGVTDNLIRLSVGIEDIDDLIEDLENAFGGI
ncbi:MAG: PLP-dependent aspartate aminotransferase family protein [Candidatus Thermoplasmatota archaeon]|jgi:cystathionine gamma-lyase|nr:PLP-dependent aspartate aminotransferase family protein [Candidatus Thermoplasmatota archaeon]MCL5789912.1 PLP-dependent aspartate aminotransferase family protein [Candidatus Thermoplasmatota archaeon]